MEVRAGEVDGHARRGDAHHAVARGVLQRIGRDLDHAVAVDDGVVGRHAQRTGARISGPIPLPTHIQRFTVLRSPHVDKKSREQFEMRIHKRLIEIENSTPQTMEFLRKLALPASVDVEIVAS